MRKFTAKAVLLDIEGTIGSIDFVKEVLFPFSRARLNGFVAERADDPEIAAILAETEGMVPGADALATLADWHDRDVKAGPLKRLQGFIWDDGYRGGAFRSHFYADAVGAMRRWHADGVRLAIYSSGSRSAQRLYLTHSVFGDLSALISDWFDTTIGPKTEAASYGAIAAAIGCEPSLVLFLSDNPSEVFAAIEAGMSAVQIVRAGTDAHPGLSNARSLDEVGVVQR